MKKAAAYILLFTLLVSFLPGSLTAADGPAAPVHISGRDTLIVGFFECWLHADGTTWQDTDHDGDRDEPGDGQQQKGELVVNIPGDLKGLYDEITYKVIPFDVDLTDGQMKVFFERGGGNYSGQVDPNKPADDCDTFDKFNDLVLYYRPDDYRLQDGTNTTTFYIPKDKGRSIDVKKQWQSALVQGRRVLLPALVEFYGQPKQTPPPVPKAPQDLPCAEKPSITNTWQELYEWQIYHPSSSTDENGNTVDDNWWETLYATPTYTETLKATLTVNTKQGIPTDPDNPKETDRESRASWEIIPYAQKNGLNPNEITRSGYGFEIKLQTTYNNDWEDHVPAGAAAHGGTYKGPDKAEAEFYDTQGCFVKYITLVPTKGKAGDKNITWELPLARFTFSNGETIYERKHYTDINVPDGKYLVKVTVSGAGKTDLCLIQKKYVTIYGDMYDDIYTRVSSKDE